MTDDKTVFLEIFGDSPILRVLDFLVVNEEFDYSMTDIAKFSGIGYATLKLFWQKLEEEGIIINTRIIGRAKMYKINVNNPIMKKFRDFYWETTKRHIRQKMEKEEITLKQ